MGERPYAPCRKFLQGYATGVKRKNETVDLEKRRENNVRGVYTVH